MNNQHNRRAIDHWTTVNVEALPAGWRHVFRVDDGSTFEKACPAMLLQEHRATEHLWDEPSGERYILRKRTEPEQPPYDTRVVFADFDGTTAELDTVEQVSNYICTIGPGETYTEDA